MKRVAVVFAVVFLIALAQIGQAADLQAGWYAGLAGPNVYADDGTGHPYLRTAGWFTTPPGNYGPFQMTGETNGSWRRITVPSTVSAGPSDSLTLPMVFGMTNGEPILYMTFSWRTIYDSSQMQLELWRERYGGMQELVWYQPLSGDCSGYVQIADNTIFEGPYYYKLNVLPEPSTGIIMVSLLGFVAASLYKRRAA